MSTYVYGVVPWPLSGESGTAPATGTSPAKRKSGKKAQPAPAPSLGVGVGEPPAEVRPVSRGELAALVSDVGVDDMELQGIRAMRRDMKAHTAVLNHVLSFTTVLPFRFGVVMPGDDAVVAHFLAPQYDRLVAALQQLGGTVELTLRGTYHEERVLEEVVAEHPQLAARGTGAAQPYKAKLELGRRIATAIQAKQRQDEQVLLDALAPLAREVRLAQPASEMMVLNASLLVDRDAVPDVDRALAELDAREGHRIRLDCVGPLPPYSFVDMRL